MSSYKRVHRRKVLDGPRGEVTEPALSNGRPGSKKCVAGQMMQDDKERM